MMYKSCKYCGRIHPEGFKCSQKPLKKEKQTEEKKIRRTWKWTILSKMVRTRDKYLCQVCKRSGRFVFENISVHHIVKVADNKELVFETTNLITLCKEHHKQADEGKISNKELMHIVEEQERDFEKETSILVC